MALGSSLLMALGSRRPTQQYTERAFRGFKVKKANKYVYTYNYIYIYMGVYIYI